MTIDGKSGDWALSGGIFASDEMENQRDKMAIWMHAMYDRDNSNTRILYPACNEAHKR